MKIEYGYDRTVKSWCIVLIDSDGNIIASSYAGNKESCKFEIETFKKDYKVTEVVKLKAY